MRCYGDRYIQCSKGMSCVLEQGTPKCQGRQLVILNMYVGSFLHSLIKKPTLTAVLRGTIQKHAVCYDIALPQ